MSRYKKVLFIVLYFTFLNQIKFILLFSDIDTYIKLIVIL